MALRPLPIIDPFCRLLEVLEGKVGPLECLFELPDQSIPSRFLGPTPRLVPPFDLTQRGAIESELGYLAREKQC